MNKLIASLFLLVILYGVFNAYFSGTKSTKDHRQKTTAYRSHAKSHQAGHFEEELSRIDTPEYAKQYIVSVINHGSYDLGFVGGVMEGGFASREDAPKIACYVLSLSGKQCPDPYPADAEMFYTSICGGCHGNDGKGLGGNYPNLTRKKLLGIERREQFLRDKIAQIKRENNG
jgi:hypothetical protein